MLGEGLRAGFGYLGIKTRTVCHVEREAYAAAVLAARMEEGSLDAAPVWSDLCTFDARAWRGKVDCIVAGFPCQDLSVAGKRAGLDGKRSGLFFEVCRIATDSGAWLMFLENVGGIASATATALDETEGELDERAAARVVGELADLGWDAEWLHVSASDVGASHGRERWFCLAWRMGAMGHAGLLPGNAKYGQQQEGAAGRAGESGTSCFALDDPYCAGTERARREKQGACAGREALDDSQRDVLIRERIHAGRRGEGQGTTDAAGAGEQLADAIRAAVRRDCGAAPCSQAEDVRRGSQDDHGTERLCGGVADTSITRLEGRELGSACDGNRGGAQTHGSTSQLRGLFAPGPADQRWSGIVSQWREFSPALEPDFRGMADGVAFAMDESRAARLRCIGNGVVPIQAAAAVVVLAGRAGIKNAT